MIAALWRLLQRFIPSDNTPSGEVFTPVVQSNREICIDLIVELQPLLVNEYRPSLANAVFILAATSNITKLINALKLINVRVGAHRALEPQNCDWTLSSITLDQFFISDDGYYIDSSRILEFIEEAQKLCELMHGAETAEVDVPEHNYRMLTKTFVSLKSILAALLSVFANDA